MVNGISGHGAGPAWLRLARTAETTTPASGENAVAPTTAGTSHPVVEKLLSGHYSAVASARLSINFSAELSAARADAQSSATAQAVTDFAAQLQAPIDQFVADAGLDEAQAATVDDLAAQLLAALQDGDVSAEAVQAGLDDFFAALTAALVPPAVEPTPPPADVPPADGVEPNGDEIAVMTLDLSSEAVEALVTDEPVEPAATLEELIAGLQRALEDLFASLLDEASGNVSERFEITSLEANGNGVAYSKFVLQYQQMTGTETSSALDLAA